jgi:hypothetical protein
MSTPHRPTRAFLIALLVLVSAAGCDSSTAPAEPTSPPATTTSPTPAAPAARVGVPFRAGQFEVTVSRVDVGVSSLPLTDSATAGGLKPYAPRNGQFVVIQMSARNVGAGPSSVSTTASTLTTGTGKTFSSGDLYTSLAGQGFEETQQPGTTAVGMIVFDVPVDAGVPVSMAFQPDQVAGSTSPTVTVSLY